MLALQQKKILHIYLKDLVMMLVNINNYNLQAYFPVIVIVLPLSLCALFCCHSHRPGQKVPNVCCRTQFDMISLINKEDLICYFYYHSCGYDSFLSCLCALSAHRLF
jgi:hypothetical protein